MQLSSVVPYLGSSDTSCLHRAAEVRLQGDHYISEVHWWGSWWHICPHPQHQLLIVDYIAKATGDWKGLEITVKLTIQNRQAQIEVVLLPLPDHQNRQRTTKSRKK